MDSERKPLVFLGGSTQDREWRKRYEVSVKNMDVFNPLVKIWDEKAYQAELKAKEEAHFYVFTIDGDNLFSIAELVDYSNKHPKNTIMVLTMKNEYKGHHYEKALRSVARIVSANGAKIFYNHSDTIDYLNRCLV